MDKKIIDNIASKLLTADMVTVDKLEDIEDVEIAINRVKILTDIALKLQPGFEKEKAELDEKYSAYIQAMTEIPVLNKKLEAFAKENSSLWENKKLKVCNGLLEMNDGGDSLTTSRPIEIVVKAFKDEFPKSYLDYVKVTFDLKKNPIKDAMKSGVITDALKKKAGLEIKKTEKFNLKIFEDESQKDIKNI